MSMKTHYDPQLKAHVSVDTGKVVRHLRHSQEYWLGEETVPRAAAAEYLRAVAGTLAIGPAQLAHLGLPASHDDPRDDGVDYRLGEIKRQFDATTVGYVQTFFNVPVWRAGLSVTLKDAPTRVVGCANNTQIGLKGRFPAAKSVGKLTALIAQSRRLRMARAAGLGEAEAKAKDPATELLAGVGAGGEGEAMTTLPELNVLNARLFAYRFHAARRYAGQAEPPAVRPSHGAASLEGTEPPFPTLPPLPKTIEDGQTYLVTELIFEFGMPGFGHVVWLALVEVESGAVLYAEPMTHGVNGLVFRRDPMVKTGDLTITSDDSAAALNAQRDDVVLNDLNPPVAGTQSLVGAFVSVQNVESPNIAPPTQPSGNDFDYGARSNDFAAVNAYYHQTELFRTIESLGFDAATYFDGTTFPIPVDHRGLGNVINAHWSPNGTGGTAHMCYALCDTTNTAEPLGRAVDPWVHWHEMGGHGTLGDHVGSGNLGFSHSAGDGLAALQMDPDSALRGLPERFRYAPFRPFTTERRFDRPVNGWAWSSANDDGQYGSEQILATCHFRLYRAIGGDHANLNRRRFASRAATYLILRTIGNLTPGTNPGNWDPVALANVPGRGAELWCEAMQDTDLLNWTSEGVFGGAYNKVIRWAFEKQGSYQPPGTPTPYAAAGAPPAVDVYIDDGRGGEYDFQPVHWHNVSMWNRNAADGLPGHQDAIAGATNYMYVKVKNRGTSAATNVTVRGYHTLPGAGLTWPLDFTAMGPAGGLNVASIGAANTEEVTVGPFEWVPNINAYGHDCVLMIASAPGDPSNIDNFTAGETIEEWRLVPNDNNIGQRNVNVVPGEAGERGLMAAVHGRVFWARNPTRRRARMTLDVQLPAVMRKNGWKLRFEGLGDDNAFMLDAGGNRRVVIEVVPGARFTADDLRAGTERDIQVHLSAAGMPVGGMIYRFDPDKALTREPDAAHRCNERAAALLQCLQLGDTKVKKVCVKKVSLDIEVDNDCDCD